MSRVAVIGEAVKTAGYAMAGALVFPAEDAEQADAAWHALPDDVAVLVLTPRAATWLGDAPRSRPGVLLAVMRGDAA